MEDLVYEIICFFKKWDLWEGIIHFGDQICASQDFKAEDALPNWRGLEGVWLSRCNKTVIRNRLQDCALIIDCCSERLTRLFEDKLYTADFDELPDAARNALLYRMDLFENCVDWYDEYRDLGWAFDDTEFDSYKEYWEFESDNQASYKMDLLREYLAGSGLLWGSDTAYNKAVAEFLLCEFKAILEKRQLRFSTDHYDNLVYCY